MNPHKKIPVEIEDELARERMIKYKEEMEDSRTYYLPISEQRIRQIVREELQKMKRHIRYQNSFFLLHLVIIIAIKMQFR